MRNCKTFAIASALIFSGFASAAVTLGEVKSAVVLGRPLDVQVPIRLDAGNDAKPGCISANLRYGETPRGAVEVTHGPVVSRNGEPGVANLRIYSPVPVDEPLVYLDLRVGCEEKATRQYTLLAMMTEPSAPAATSVADAMAAPGGRSRPAPGPGPRLANASDAPAKRAAALPPANQFFKPTGKPKLSLEPLTLGLNLNMDTELVLKASSDMLIMPPEDLAKRAQAAAWWRALNAGEAGSTGSGATTAPIQSEIQSILTVTAQDRQNLLELTEKVRQLESSNASNIWIVALIALCLAGWIAMAWVWYRWRTPGERHWSEEPEPVELDVQDMAPLKKPTRAAARPRAKPPAEVDFDLDAMASAPAVATATPAVAPPTANAAAMPSVPAALTAESNERLDIRRQADFFVEMGLYDQAIEVLTTHISLCGESSPLACLDLLKVYHLLGREADFEFIRNEFNHWFTGVVPPFSDFDREGLDLESYPDVMKHIVKGWPEIPVLDYIEQCLYHHSGEPLGRHFELPAYRELLLLHGVAKRLIRQQGSGSDELSYELLRIPASTQDRASNAQGQETDSRAAAHRAGAHLRGSWNADHAQNQALPAGAAPSSSPLGAMRLPAAVASVQAPDASDSPDSSDEHPTVGPNAESDRTGLTDFDFLDLR